MALAVQILLLANAALYAGLPALQQVLEELADLLLGINTNIQVQSSPSGAARATREARNALGDAAFTVAGATLSCAEAKGHAVLAAKVDFPRSRIVAGKSHVVVARCQGVIDAATENIKALADYGVTPKILTDLKQRLQVYDTLRGLPRQAKAAGGAATRQLEKLFPKVDRLLAKRLDPLAWQLREQSPEFYEKYLVARAIVGAPTSSAEETPESNVVPVTGGTTTTTTGAVAKPAPSPAAGDAVPTKVA